MQQTELNMQSLPLAASRGRGVGGGWARSASGIHSVMGDGAKPLSDSGIEYGPQETKRSAVKRACGLWI